MGGFTGQRWQDTPEIIQMCLNCGKPTCVRECEELKQALREKRRRAKEARRLQGERRKGEAKKHA